MTFVKIILYAIAAATAAAVVVFAYSVVRLSNGPSEAVHAGAQVGAINTFLAFSCVLAIGLVCAVFYGMVRLARRAWRED